MQSNDPQLKFSNEHQREYEREQECLKAMTTTSGKVEAISADMMIENLLKNSFKKLPEMPVRSDHSYAELPPWLQCNSAAVPAQYKYLWSLVQSTVDLADTQKVSQLLLTSGLQVDVLGFIWSLANKAIPGQLTKQEFYIVLALVSLVQNGYTFNNLNILKLLTVPSMPVLQLNLLKFPMPQLNIIQKANSTRPNSIKEFQGLQPKPMLSSDINEDKNSFISCGINDKISLNNNMEKVVGQKEMIEENFAVIAGSNKTAKPVLTKHIKDLHKNSNFPCIGSSPTAELEDDFSAFQSVSAEKDSADEKVNHSIYDSCDEFSEFQSASSEHADPFEIVVINQRREIPKISLPKTLTGKFTNVKSNVKISPESGKKLKVLSAAESLSSLPESKISSSNEVSTCIPALGSNHSIGSRLAGHSFSSQFEPEPTTTKCHRHHKVEINPSSPPSEVILGVKTKNLETVITKCRTKNSKAYRTFVLKETKIRDDDDAAEIVDSEQFGNELDSSIMHSREKTRQIEIPMLGTFNETVFPTQSKPQSSSVDLITVQEDKYSALREIELELNREKSSDTKEINDDFGDFLSADISTLVTTESPQSLTEPSHSNSDLLFFKNDEKDGWGEWNFNAETPLDLPNTSSAKANDFIGVGNASLFNTETDLFQPFNLLTFDNAKEISQSDSFSSNQQHCFGEDSKSGSTQSADNAVMFTEINEQLNDLFSQPKKDQMSVNELDNTFWGFVSSESKSTTDNTPRHDSPPQLDLNASPTDESEQEIIWKKCIDCCYSLIQKGFDIFNNIVTKSVLDEVFAAPETENYLNNLNIVCHISKRVSQNFNSFSSAQNELEKLWGRLQELCFEYNIKLKPDEDNFSEGKFRCGICLMYIGPEIVTRGSSSYHPSCGNLWINCVERVLPSLI